MASRKTNRGLYDFQVYPGVTYIIDPLLKPDTFFEDAAGTFHIGAGTDLHLRLFELNLSKADVRFLKSLKIDPFEVKGTP